MTSEIRANVVKNRVGLGTIEYSNTGPVISGVTTAFNFKTGTSNLHSTGLNIFDLDVDGHTNLDNVSIAGVTTITGDFSVTGTGVVADLKSTNNDYVLGLAGNNSSVKVYVGTDSSGNFKLATGSGVDERLRITSDGKIGINQSTPTAELEVVPNGTGTTSTIFIHAPTHNTNVASEAILKFGYGHSGNPDGVGHIKLVEGAGNNFDADFIFGLPTNNSAGGSVTNERFRIKYNGQVCISDAGNNYGNARLNIRPTNRTTAFSASDGDTWHDFVLMQGGGAQTNAVGIAFEINSGGSYHKNAGTGICAVKNGTNSDYGSDLVFITRPQGAVAQERLRITSDGVIGINDANPGSGKKVKVLVANNSSYQMAVNLTNNINADINFYIKTNESLIAPSTNTPLCLGTGGAEKLRITSGGQLLISGNTGWNESSSLLSIATDDAAGANMLSDSSAIYNHNNPAFIHVQNRYNTGTGQEAGIIFHSKSSYNGSWAIYSKRTSSNFLADLIFRNRTASSTSAERLRIGSSGQIGLGGANYGSSGQVLTSQGSGSAPTWATPSTSTDPTTGVANNNVWQTVGSNISWHTNYNNTDNTIGSVSNCNQSNVYAIDVKVRIVFNNSGGTYNYNNTHGYIMGYVYQDGKNYFDKGVYTEAQHFDLYYNVFGTVYTIPWDPSGTQNLKIYCTYAYNTSTQNYFNFQVINKWTR